jgi:hypothetical protein
MMQPYAWLFANGYLTTDDRTWPTAYRGPVAIHASQKLHGSYYEFLLEHTRWSLPAPETLERGGVVGIADLVECLAPTVPLGGKLERIELRRSHFGAPGHHGLVFASPRTVPFVAFRGNRGLFDIPDRLLGP